MLNGKDIALVALLYIVISLWNIPHTIAARYICEFLLLILILSSRVKLKQIFFKNKFLLVLFIYLIIQLIFFSQNYAESFANFKAEWMHFILFSIIGYGAGILVAQKDRPKLLLYLGVAFSTPLLLHLALSVMKGISIGGIPWRYLGINEIHGDFGYPAMQASILLATYYLYQSKSNAEKILVIILMIACITSPLLAQSRGGTGFAVASILFVYATYSFFGSSSIISPKRKLLEVSILILLLFSTYKIALNSDPTRWSGMGSRLIAGLEGDPILIQCKGIEYIRNELIQNGVDITPKMNKEFKSIADGEGLRTVAARSGYELITQNPIGINQSKQAYEIALISLCKGSPKIFIAHAHNGWIDTALAIGIPGALLLLLTILAYLKDGFTCFKENVEESPYGLALFASCLLWILRGFFDSTFRDQMLEMQAFIFPFLLAVIIYKSKFKRATQG